MSIIERGAVAAPHTRGRGLVFWLRRYLPAEVVGTAAMLAAGALAAAMTASPGWIAVAALVGEIVGFYAVLAVVILLEQSRVAPSRASAIRRTSLLLVAEFGVAEVLDTLLIRPAALMLGVWVLRDPMWGLLVGKIVADVVFYLLAAGAFSVTDRAGLRAPRDQEPTP